MKFSVITPSFNCGPYIKDNFASIEKQGIGSDELEHWVIDGGSTDGTVDILKATPDIKWISERDKGLSDAVNKGIQRAKGDWIIWLNADDMLAENALKLFLEFARHHPEGRIFEGAETYLRYDGTAERTVPGSAHTLKTVLGTGTGMNQAAMFVHREVYEKAGLLDISVRYAMDYEWLARAMHHYSCIAVPHVLALYRRRQGSIMDANMPAHFQTFLEVRRRYHQPYFSRGEFKIRFYLWTEPLRRIRWLRASVRRVKRLFGQEPLHPMS